MIWSIHLYNQYEVNNYLADLSNAVILRERLRLLRDYIYSCENCSDRICVFHTKLLKGLLLTMGE